MYSSEVVSTRMYIYIYIQFTYVRDAYRYFLMNKYTFKIVVDHKLHFVYFINVRSSLTDNTLIGSDPPWSM